MQCTSCGSLIQDDSMFCPKCGKKLPEIIKEEIQKELRSELKEFQPPDIGSKIPTHVEKNNVKSKVEEQEIKAISPEYSDMKKEEYRTFLKSLFSDRILTAEKITLVADKIKELGLGAIEAQNIQRDVAKELGIEIQESDLANVDIVLEINTNKNYFAGEMGNLEFRMTSLSKSHLDNLCASAHFKNLNKKEPKSFLKIVPSQPHILRFPFIHTYTGEEIVEVSLQYFDSKGNPSIYDVEFEVGILSKEEKREGHRSINISFTAEKIMGCDFEHMAEIYGERKEEKQKKSSFYDESEKRWKRLPLDFNEGATTRLREEITINKKIADGENHLKQGERLKEEGERLFYKDRKTAREVFENALNNLKDAESCFLKVMEINPEHKESFAKIGSIKAIYSEIENKIGKCVEERAAPKKKLTSGRLIFDDLQKKICIYSKKTITLGRDTKNDLVLRLFPYRWKDEYDGEVRKMMRDNVKLGKIPLEYFPSEKNKKNLINSAMISSKHAEIVEKTANFYIRDIGSTNGTFVDGKKLKPNEEHLLKDDSRIHIAGVLDLEFRFFGEFKKTREKGSSFDSCFTVLGEKSDSCFGIDKKGIVNAIKIRRLNNYSEREEYIILIREVTVGSSRTNAIVLEGEKVSDIHAKIFYRDEQYWIEDLNSRHGTWVNGEEAPPLVEVSLGEKAEILVGDIKLNFEGIYR